MKLTYMKRIILHAALSNNTNIGTCATTHVVTTAVLPCVTTAMHIKAVTGMVTPTHNTPP